MKRIKQIFSLILVLVMAVSLVACGGSSTPAGGNSSTPSSTSSSGSSGSNSSGGSGGSGSSGGSSGSSEPVEVVWWTYFGDTNIQYLQKIIDAFNASQDKYHVTIIFQGGQAEVNAKLQSTAQKDLPAMFSGAVENVAMYDAADFCVPLQEYLDKDTEGWPELEGTWGAIRAAYCDTEGNLVGYPIGYSYPGIFYNADMLKKAGIDPKSIQTYEDLYEACKKLVKGGYTTFGIGFHNDGYYPTASLGREGVKAYNNDNGYSGPITECLYTDDQNVYNALYTMVDVYKKLHAEKLCVPYGADYQGEIIPLMASGDCAMLMGVVSMTTKILNAAEGKFEVGIVPLPSPTKNGKRTGEPAGGTGSFICNNGNPEAMQGAYEFIKFASTGDQAAFFAVSTGYLAPNMQAYNSSLYQDYMKNTFPAIQNVYDSLANSDDSANNPYIPISNEMKAANKLMIETVASDTNADVDKVIKTSEEMIQEAIDLYNAAN